MAFKHVLLLVALNALYVAGEADTTLGFSKESRTVSEGVGEVYIDVVRSGKALDKTATVNYATKDGTADSASDYTQTAGSLVFKPGVNKQFIKVKIVNDDKKEADEFFTVELTATEVDGVVNPAVALGDKKSFKVIIKDDD